MKIEFTGEYDRMYRVLVENTDGLKILVAQRVKLFKKNPSDTRLANHALRKRLSGKWAFSITDDIRIVYQWTGRKSVRFLAIGIHAAVYKRN